MRKPPRSTTRHLPKAMTETPETLTEKLDRLDRQAAELTKAVQNSATRRSTQALAIAIAAIFGLLVLGTINASVQSHSGCVRGNEARVAIDTSDRVRTEAFISTLVAVVSVGRPPEAVARAQAQGDALRAGIDSNPELVQARSDLRPRSCSYWPF